jgi:ribosomal protein S18 acetylase RimI-like enzyme
MTSEGQSEVTFRPMTATEFDRWTVHAITSYANDVATATGQPLEAALSKAREQFPMLLPNGLDTDGMSLLVILDTDSTEVGTIWLGPHSDKSESAFVWDIEIAASQQGRGLGRAAMLAAERFAVDSGYSEIGLNVFGFNDRARRLYDSLGYRAISTSMTKTLRVAGDEEKGDG